MGRDHDDQFALASVAVFVEKNTPRKGIWPRTGTLVAVMVEIFWISPPMTNVWPVSISTVVWTRLREAAGHVARR